MFSRVLRARGPLPKLPTFRTTRPSYAFLNHRTMWDVAALDAVRKEFGADWPGKVEIDEVRKWLVQKSLKKVDEYLEESKEEAIKKATRDAKLVGGGNYEPLLPCRYDEQKEILESIIETSWSGQNFVLVSGPKAIGKSTLLNSVARELNTLPGYRCIWVQCQEDENGFLEGWLTEMGLPLKMLAVVPSFEAVAKLLIEGGGPLKEKVTIGKDKDGHGETVLTVDKKVKTIIFVDGMRARHSYSIRLQDIARRQSQYSHAMYVLIASDTADAFRSIRQFETRINQIDCTPFDYDTMKEFLRYELRRRSTLMFGDANRVVIDDEEKDENGKTEFDGVVDVVLKYTWQATNGEKFVVKGIQRDGKFDVTKVEEFAKEFCNKYSTYVKERLYVEVGWDIDKVRELIDAFGNSTEMDVSEYESKFGHASILSQRNFAYDDEKKIYLAPEVYHGMKYLIQEDDALKQKSGERAELEEVE